MLLTLTYAPTPTSLAQTPAIDYDTDDDGLIEISNLEQLDAIRYNPDEEKYSVAFPNALPAMGCLSEACIGYELTTNLDFNDPSSYASDSVDKGWSKNENAEGWIPIGNTDENNHYAILESSFNAIFEGNQHTISNLFINQSQQNDIGLFGASQSEIRRIGLMDVDVTGNLRVGALVGYNFGSVIESYSTGSVSGKGAVGGLIGLQPWGSKVADSYSNCSVSSNNSEAFGGSAGGLVGANSQGTIDRSYATGNVTGGYSVGALSGFNGGKVTRSYATGNVAGRHSVGGLVGRNSNSSSIIGASYATGDTQGEEAIGGLVGRNENRAKIIASYATGNVSGNTSIAGLVGIASGHGGIIASYANGEVKGTQDAAGLAGQNTTPQSITASYWNIETTGQTLGVANGFSSGAEGLTNDELATPVEYIGIYSTWKVDIDNADGDSDETTGIEAPWDFGSNTQLPVLQVDFNNDGIATAQEFGNQTQMKSTAKLTIPKPSPTPDTPSEMTIDYDTDDDGLIEISKLEQLDAIRYDIDGDGAYDHVSYEEKYTTAFPNPIDTMGCYKQQCIGYELTTNLDFNDPNSYSSTAVDKGWSKNEGQSGWIPIGDSGANEQVPLYAVFDGGGHTIKNLFISRRDTGVIGLFAIMENQSIIRNIALIDVEIEGDYAVGALVGITRWDSYINKVKVTGNISGDRYVGGIIGRQDAGRIERSHTNVNVSGRESIGGLVGYAAGNQIFASYATGNINGQINVGGLVGRNDSLIRLSYANANTSGNQNIGGLVGSNYYGRIRAAYADGEVSGNQNIGGLAGYTNTYSDEWIKTTYSIAKVTTTSGENVGGFVGEHNGTIEDSYWDTQTSEQSIGTGAGTPQGIEGKTSDELQEPTDYTEIYSKWNIDINSDGTTDHPWDFGDSDQYPVLKADLDNDGVSTWQEFGNQRPMILPETGGASIPTWIIAVMAITGIALTTLGYIYITTRQPTDSISRTS